MLVSQATTERLRGIVIVCLLLVVNLISCYVRVSVLTDVESLYNGPPSPRHEWRKFIRLCVM